MVESIEEVVKSGLEPTGRKYVRLAYTPSEINENLKKRK
jgi:hypothetical protein